MQQCVNEGELVTVLYGHLSPATIAIELGATLQKGKRIGTLGSHESQETDGERAHLHLGVHRGATIDLRGYVEKEEALNDWINPLTLLR